MGATWHVQDETSGMGVSCKSTKLVWGTAEYICGQLTSTLTLELAPVTQNKVKDAESSSGKSVTL